MAHIKFIDQTIRDGQQSLWGMRMRAKHILPITERLNRSGFSTIEITGTTIQSVLVREFAEDPYQGLDLINAGLPDVIRRGGMRPDTAGFTLQPYSVIDLSVSVMAKHGINSFWLFDCLYNLDRMERLATVIGKQGYETIPTISFALSELHTDAFFADVARKMAAWPHVDAIQFADEAGVLTPERASTLLPALIKAAGDVPIELHCHNPTGLAPVVYLKGIELGITRIHTCIGGLANGYSLPSTEVMLDNIRALGHTSDVDDSDLPSIADHIAFVAAREGYELGVPMEYSLRHYTNQMPGGMTGTLKAQLAKHGRLDMFDAVLNEVGRVRKEFGFPVMATPFAQIIGTQAVLNVLTGERFSVAPDESVLYAMGAYGDPPGAMDQNVKDKILESKRGKELKNWELPQPSLEELRLQYGGPSLSDEELLLRILVPGSAVDAMIAAGPIETYYPRADENPLVRTLREVSLSTARNIQVNHGDFSLSLKR
ncbi:pyruvate carboxylase [Achromobacter aloeverae]